MSVVDRTHQLLKNGYQVIPILPSGKPLVKGFLGADVEYNEGDAKYWCKDSRFEGANVALVAGKNDVFALDFDVDEPKLARKLLKVVRNHWPDVPVRKCNDPRFAILFRATGELATIRNGHSKGYKVDNDTPLQQIELIGNNTITLFGNHRKSNNRYTWSKINPYKTPVEDLPELSLQDVKRIFGFFEKRIDKDLYTETLGSTFSKPQEKTTFENVTIKRVVNSDEVDEILATCRGDDRQSWIDMGMALHAQYQGSVDGMHIWDEWSSKFEGYEGIDDIRYNWDSFRLTSGGLTMATMLSRVKKPMPEDPEEVLAYWLKTYVHVTDPREIADLSRAPDESLTSTMSFKEEMKGHYIERETTDGRTGEVKTKLVPIYDVWSADLTRLKAYKVDYLPIDKRLITGYASTRTRNYYNSYTPTTLKVIEGDHKLKMFFDHMKYLFPDDGDMEWMMTWIAQMVQDPCKRFRTAPLSISTFHGTGRGWLGLLLGELVGDSNAKTLDIKLLATPGAKTPFLDKSVLCIVNETYTKGRNGQRYAVDDRLRTILADSKQDVDIKWGSQAEQIVYTRFFLQSNHLDALIIDELDNRIEVFINRALPKNKDYYNALYALLKDPEFMNQVYSYLMRMDIDTDMLTGARRSKSRDTLIRATKSNTANALYAFKDIIGDSVFTPPVMHSFISKYNAVFNSASATSMDSLVNLKELNFLLKAQVRSECIRGKQQETVKYQTFGNHDLTTVNDTKLKKSVNNCSKKIKLYFKLIIESRDKQT